MALIFPKWTNRLPLMIGVGAVAVPLAAVAGFWYYGSPKFTDVGYRPTQPVPFSHKLHAGELGMDCRYCHNTVERASHAAVPPVSTCMNCHKVIKPDSPALELVRKSYASQEPIKWSKVHIFPEYVKFPHSAHVSAGVGCVSCHGRIDQMKVVTQNQPLNMGWCLECHRAPGPNLRPVSEVTNMSWDPAKANYDYHKDTARMHVITPPTHCSGCHR